MKFQNMIEESLKDESSSLFVITLDKSIKIDSFIDETEEYLIFERQGNDYLIFKDKIIGFKSGSSLRFLK
ncbi:hypothetical protein [Staphylococcus haemolyticus]|uniref:hypothetical protein n=1 Tax=Staphylococcus haemolyticus TaxID=1283 RepID=UPI001A9AA3EE|nr:hypothetical protein [Staphylococcus haemolyticus]MBO1278774.1 hypothetical protein [Staphylococcus haemolyticus]